MKDSARICEKHGYEITEKPDQGLELPSDNGIHTDRQAQGSDALCPYPGKKDVDNKKPPALIFLICDKPAGRIKPFKHPYTTFISGYWTSIFDVAMSGTNPL